MTWVAVDESRVCFRWDVMVGRFQDFSADEGVELLDIAGVRRRGGERERRSECTPISFFEVVVCAVVAVEASVAGATLERYKDRGMIASHALVRQDGKAFECICEIWCADG